MCYSKEELPEVLYHYCSWGTFENIIKHRTIRFSDVMKSKDTREIVYLFERYLERQGKKEGSIFPIRTSITASIRGYAMHG